MQQKTLLGLGIVTVVAVGAAALALQSRNAAGPEDLGPFLESLAGAGINQVAGVTIEKGGETVRLERADGEWVLADRGGYPAEYEKVKPMVVALQKLEIEEKKTSKPSYHERLNVLPPTEGSDSTRVTLRDAAGEELAAFIVSPPEYRGNKQKVYVRHADEDQVWLCDGRLTVGTRLTDWVDTTALRLDSERVQDVTITHADGEVVQLGRSPENHTQFVVENVPPGREERYAGIATGVGTALASFNFDDVRPVGEIDFTAEPVAQTRYVTHDGLVLLVETAKQDDKTWARLSAAYEAPPEPEPEPEPVADDEPADGQPAEAGAADEHAGHDHAEGEGHDEAASEEAGPGPETIRAEAAELAGRFAGWAFAVPSYKLSAITKRMADLLAELPEPEAPEEAAGTAPPTLPLGEDPPPADDGGTGGGGG